MDEPGASSSTKDDFKKDEALASTSTKDLKKDEAVASTRTKYLKKDKAIVGRHTKYFKKGKAVASTSSKDDIKKDEAVASTSSKDDIKKDEATASGSLKDGAVASTSIKELRTDEAVPSTSTKDEAVASTSTKDVAVASASTRDEAVASTSTKYEAVVSTSTIYEIVASISTQDEDVASTSTEDEAVASTSAITNIEQPGTVARMIMEKNSDHLEEKLIKEDCYIRRAQEQEWRSRNSFKLLEIDERFKILNGVKRAVDLYACPGIWTQVLSRKLVLREVVYIRDKPCLFFDELALQQRLEAVEEPEYGKEDNEVVIVAVDSVGIPEYPGVTQVDGDLTDYFTVEKILDKFDGNKADLVVCSKIINHTNLRCIDLDYQATHVVHVLHIACNILRSGGTLVLALTKQENDEFLKSQLLSVFKEVDMFKPRSSKRYETEIFAICRHYSPPEGFDPKLMTSFIDFSSTTADFDQLTGINRVLIPFLIYGDLSAYPLSAENEVIVENVPTVLPYYFQFSPRSKAKKKNDLDHYLQKMNEAIRLVRLRAALSPKKNPPVMTSSAEPSSSSRPAMVTDQLYDDADGYIYDSQLCELVQKVTKIKKYPPEKEPESVNVVSDLQFLYEDEFTDPVVLRECLERLKLNEQSSTCTCDSYAEFFF